jgi:hypothetical protein
MTLEDSALARKARKQFDYYLTIEKNRFEQQLRRDCYRAAQQDDFVEAEELPR